MFRYQNIAYFVYNLLIPLKLFANLNHHLQKNPFGIKSMQIVQWREWRSLCCKWMYSTERPVWTQNRCGETFPIKQTIICFAWKSMCLLYRPPKHVPWPLSLSLFPYRPMNLVHLVNTPVYQLLLTISGGCVLINKSQSIWLVLIKTLFNKLR